jgi:hypothetical protein
MMHRINLPETPPFGLVEAIEAAGVSLNRRAGVWYASDAAAAEAIAAAHDPLPPAKASRLADLAAYRYEQEVGGVDVQGVRIDTSREARNNLTAAVATAQLAADAGQPFSVQWKGLNGGFVPMAAADLRSLGLAVATHVAGCFANEGAVAAQIAALTDVDTVLRFDISAAWAACAPTG